MWVPPMETIMKTFAKAAAGLLVAGTFAGCSGMTEKQRNTAVGAGIGAVGGALVTGSAAGTLGGAALGGVVGNVATDKK
jgi:osmotically inducible lipoprotein OsmB